MIRKYVGLFLVALVTLMTELTLTRIFDAALGTNMAYLVITCAIFAFGLAGIYSTLWPLTVNKKIDIVLTRLAVLLAFFTLLVPTVLSFIPNLEFLQFKGASIKTLVSFTFVYVLMVVPFFLSGLITTILISTFAERIRQLYFWDLTGAGIGSIILIPFLPIIGAGGLLLCGSAIALVAAGLFSSQKIWARASLVCAAGLMVIPFSGLGAFFDIQALTVERYAKKNRANLLSSVELTRWDPVSKIDIIDLSEIKMKGISYDGGSQHSAFISFDGNFKRLRDNLSLLQDHIINPAVLAANYLKRDSNQQVMVIGSAGGKEIKVALMYGAGHVDAVELVGTVVELGKNKYADYIGNLFNHPKVNVMVGEGRNVLRSMEQKYDIIQIYSNHTTSSIASGTGAMATGYLFTVEAFQEYFEKLNENGILQVNQLLYPRLVTAGAAAWKQLGRQDFQKHVVVIELGEVDWMPTVLVKNTPWTEQQVNELKDFLFGFPNWLGKEFRFTEDPIYPEKSFLSPVFYSGAIPESLADRVDYRIKPATDDSPYFIFLRNKLGLVEPKDDKFMNQAISELLNRPLYPWFITVDIFHFLVGGVASLFWAVAFIVLPLRFSTVGKAHWPGKVNALLYFACLGSGFIIFELALIHLFMHFIGNPLYAYSVTIFSMLLGAGLGSLCSSSLGISLQERWEWPFWGIFVTGVAILVGHSPIFDLLLGQPTWLRVLVSASMIVPFGFFLGIPFPLGILALEGYERMAIPWAWGINGLFTVIGGLTCILLSLLYGFTVAFVFAMSIYIIGLWQFWKLRGVAIHGEALG